MKNIKTENELEAFIMELHNIISHELREKAMKFNFTFSQMETLRYVVKEKNPTMKDVAKYLNITPPSVTVIIECLINKGLLKKEIDRIDHRLIRIMVTPKSSKIINSIKNKKIEVIKKIISKLNQGDKKEFLRILTLLNTA
jgi:DNA-binding MarR family transcriptional regulator